MYSRAKRGGAGGRAVIAVASLLVVGVLVAMVWSSLSGPRPVIMIEGAPGGLVAADPNAPAAPAHPAEHVSEHKPALLAKMQAAKLLAKAGKMSGEAGEIDLAALMS